MPENRGNEDKAPPKTDQGYFFLRYLQGWKDCEDRTILKLREKIHKDAMKNGENDFYVLQQNQKGAKVVSAA